MSVNPISPDVFQGGQMTDLPAFSGTFNGTELFEVVAAPAGQSNAAAGVNYAIDSTTLASQLNTLRSSQMVISQGQYASALTPLVVPVTISRIYVNKVTPEPTYIQFGAASAQGVDVLVKDVAGTADGSGNGIFLTVTADGIVNPTITVGYGGLYLRPVTSLNLWTLGGS